MRYLPSSKDPLMGFVGDAFSAENPRGGAATD